VARAIQVQLERDGDNVLWADGVFSPTDYALESLERQLELADCGVFVVTPDDVTRSRGRQRKTPRDNVILELGLFVGRLGRRRAVLVLPRNADLKLPSDLFGINNVTYEYPQDSTMLIAAVAPACTHIRELLSRLSPRAPRLSWDDTCGLVKKLAGMLRRSPANGGYSFDVLVGLSRGGIIVADLLSRIYGGNVPTVCLWADRHTAYPTTTFSPPDNWLNAHVISALANDKIHNILVVDDVTRACRTLVSAVDFLRSELPNRTIKSAILISPPAGQQKFDYIAHVADTRSLQTPFSILED
jgi:hypoxanthine phosphoribosyltransferase